MKDTKQRLFEVMGRLDKTFKPTLNEWNFDKKKDEASDNDSEFEKKEDDESKEHEESETDAEEKKEYEEKKELDENKPKIPVNAIAKVGGK